MWGHNLGVLFLVAALPAICDRNASRGACILAGLAAGAAVLADYLAIAALPFVREDMVRQQQAMGKDKGLVMDGRDIGTVVFPDAELKVFVTARAEVRAERRYKELLGKGEEADYDEILKNVQERDYIDSHREVAPLRPADDALILDNSEMTIPEQNEWLYEKYLEKVKGKKDKKVKK